MSGGFLTPKAIANRIKAKGLQKLRWYCQMCEKQCRDENGFKCHCTSESHLRQMSLFAENATSYMHKFSKEFEHDFVQIMKRRGRKRIKANALYQELVSDRGHIHMNSTKWSTLSTFVQYLGKSGQAIVDYNGKDWYVQYIDRDPEAMARAEALAKRSDNEKDAEERAAEMLAKQIELANKAAAEAGLNTESEEPTEFKRDDPEQKLVVKLAPSTTSSSSASALALAPKQPIKPKLDGVFAVPLPRDRKDKEPEEDKEQKSHKSDKDKRKRSALDDIIAEEEERKAKAARAKEKATAPSSSSSSSSSSSDRVENWLYPNIVVKVINKSLAGGRYYKQKGVVQRVHDKFVAELKMNDSGHVLKIDQSELETVIPAIGGAVMVVNGRYRGEEATLLKLNEASTYSVQVRLHGTTEKRWRDRELPSVPFEDICKLAS